MNSGCHCRRLPGCSHHWLQGDPLELDRDLKTGSTGENWDVELELDQLIFLI